MIKQFHYVAAHSALLALIAVAGCSKQPATAQTSNEQGKNSPEAKAFKGEMYRAKNRSETVTIVSDDELEIRKEGVNLICKYMRQDGQLRVVANVMGTSQALYYRIVEDGLQDERGTIFYKPSRFLDPDWAAVYGVYQRRKKLIGENLSIFPATFDKSVLSAVRHALDTVDGAPIDAAHAPDDAAQLERFQRAQSQFSQAISRLLVVSESYPELRKDTAFRDFQAQLEGIEHRISVERDNFSNAVKNYNALLPSGSRRKPFFASSSQTTERQQ